MSSIEKYREFAKNNEMIPLFSQPWWLDAVCYNRWNVLIIQKGQNIVATLPYHFKSNGLNNSIVMPKLTQFLGPFIIFPENQKYETRLSYEKIIMNELINSLPKFKSFSQNFQPTITNWLPFFWNGFKQTTRYTYRIENTTDLDTIWDEMNNNTRKAIRKAEKLVEVTENNDINLFYEIHKKTFERQRLGYPYSLEQLKRIDEACGNRNCRKILIAKDKNGAINAGTFFVWDNNTIYYLMGGSDPVLRSSGANVLLIWEGIKFASTIKKSFDFEGSMNETIEKFFRSFGAKQHPYFTITKNNSLIIKTKKYFKKFLK